MQTNPAVDVSYSSVGSVIWLSVQSFGIPAVRHSDTSQTLPLRTFIYRLLLSTFIKSTFAGCHKWANTTDTAYTTFTVPGTAGKTCPKNISFQVSYTRLIYIQNAYMLYIRWSESPWNQSGRKNAADDTKNQTCFEHSVLQLHAEQLLYRFSWLTNIKNYLKKFS